MSVGYGVFLAMLMFQIFMMRRVLDLRWHAIASFLALGRAVGSIWGWVLAQMGLVTY